MGRDGGKVKKILETQENSAFKLILQNAQHTNSRFFIRRIRKKKYLLLVCFCCKLGMETVEDEKKVFKYWTKDTTSYGYYLAGRCYSYGFGVDRDYDKKLNRSKIKFFIKIKISHRHSW